MTKLLKRISVIAAAITLATAAFTLPATAASDTEMGRIAAGQEYTMFVDASGDLYTFGRNFAHEKGQSEDKTLTPTKVMSGVKQVSAGANHYVVLKKDGSVWTSGSGNQGELGDGRNYMANMSSSARSDTTVRTTKVFENAVAVAAGNSHTLVLDKNGDVWATGRNMSGELGDGTKDDRATFAKVKGLSNIKAISAGDWHNLALAENGDLYVWGSSPYGALGDGRGVDVIISADGWSHTANPHEALIPQKMMEGVRTMSAGGGASYIILNDGSLWACGYGVGYRLGSGDEKSTPTPIHIMDGVQEVSGGNGFALALKTDGTVWGWGQNTRGGLGVNSRNTVQSPVKVADNAVAISAGWDHSLILKEDGHLYAAGGNDRGQQGNGKILEVPVQLTFKKVM